MQYTYTPKANDVYLQSHNNRCCTSAITRQSTPTLPRQNDVHIYNHIIDAVHQQSLDKCCCTFTTVQAQDNKFLTNCGGGLMRGTKAAFC